MNLILDAFEAFVLALVTHTSWIKSQPFGMLRECICTNIIFYNIYMKMH